MVGGVKATFIALLAFSLCLSAVGQDKPKSLPKDIPSLKALAEKGDAEAQFQLAENYYQRAQGYYNFKRKRFNIHVFP